MNNQKKVLLVSENVFLWHELSSRLKESQVEVSSTDLRGSLLIKLLKGNTPDMTILDSNEIPGTAIKQLIDIRHSLDIPVILINSHNVQQKIIEVVGFDERSSSEQPMSLDNLVDRIEGILNGCIQ